MKKRYINIQFIVILFFGVSLGFSQSLSKFFTKSNSFFKTYVKDGKVDYSTLKKENTLLIEVLEVGSKTTVSVKDANTYRAFWINAYNLTVIKSVVEKYPVKSPLDIAGFFDKTKHDIAGKKLTLNDIENKILRGNFDNDPRFHFVLVCAGLGCPPLINNAYLPNTLEKQLNTQTKIAINNPLFIQVKMKKKKVGISQIFDWYKNDFITKNQSLIDFLNTYRTIKIPDNFKTYYYEYNWKINQIK